METCVFCPNPRTIHCEECQAFSCSSCAITQHLPATKQSHIMQHLCEECEEEIAEKFCENCDQNLCPACDTKIHNKGKRAKHAKKVVSEPLSLDKIQNLAFVTAPFFQECLNSGSNQENLRTKIAELVKDIDHNSLHEEGNQQHRLTVLLLEQDPDSKDESTLSVFSQVLEELKLLKNIIPVQENKKEASGVPTKAKAKENLTQRRATGVASFLKGLDMVDAVFIYDVNPSTEQLAELLNEVPTLKQQNRQIFLNNNNVDFEQSPISSSPFSRPRRSSSINKQQEEFTLTEAAFKNEATFPSDEVTSSEIIFSTPISGLLTPESSFSSFEIPTKSSIRGTHNAFVLNSKENIHPNLSSTMSFGGLYSDPEDYGGFSSQMLSTFESKKALVPEFQPLKNIEIRGSRKFGDLLQEEIKVFANKGELLIPKETLLTRIKESFQLRSLNEAENILSEAEAKKIVHITIRKFPNYNPYCYVGLLLNVLTLESLTWVIKSIKCDLMTPTEKLILSRIKECYGLKIDPVFWKVILNTINSVNNSPNNNRGNNNNCPLYVKQILDPVTNLETNALYLNNDDWEPEDQGVVDETTMEWKAVLAFIEDFFRESPIYQEKKEKERFTSHNVLKELPQGGSRWNNSVENILNRSANENEQRAYKVNDDVKAIPGGRYGCAQFIKYCGPENLKDLSIGKLSLLVQEAINKGILRYQRTLLVKNAMNDNSSLSGLSSQSDFHNEVMHSLNAERKAKLISMVKEALLEILMENPRGISLAQIPFHLKKKLKFNVDFQELGFPKLKNFLTTLKNLVIIESVGTNHTCVKLKEPLQGGFGGGKGNFHKKRIGDIDKAGLRMSQYTRSDQTLNMRNYENEQQIMRPDNELIRLITEKIRGIVTVYRQGIAIGDLYRELCNQLKVGDISFIPFGCENFYQFLLRYEEQIVDISVKKNGFIVYPKSQDFWVKGKEPGSAFAWQTPGKILRSPPGFYEGHSGQQQQQQMLDPRLTMDQKFKSQPNYGGYKPSAYTFPMETPTPHYSGQSQSQGSYGGSRGVGNTAENPNFLNISPIIYSGNDANEGHFPDNNNRASGVKYTNVNVSTWNLNYNYGQDSGEQQQNPMLWQFNPQPVQKRQQAFPVPGFQQQQEESQLELQNNLRFIEELLQNDEEKGVMSGYMERSTEASLGGFNMTPSQGFSGKPFPKNRS